MVLSLALLFLGARQFCVSMHTASEGLVVWGQGACSLSRAGSRGAWPLFAEATADPHHLWTSASTGQISASACGPGG